jgi:hypothetical protein
MTGAGATRGVHRRQIGKLELVRQRAREAHGDPRVHPEPHTRTE